MKKFIRVTLLYSLGLWLTGCGQSGPLYLPDQQSLMQPAGKKRFYE